MPALSPDRLTEVGLWPNSPFVSYLLDLGVFLYFTLSRDSCEAPALVPPFHQSRGRQRSPIDPLLPEIRWGFHLGLEEEVAPLRPVGKAFSVPSREDLAPCTSWCFPSLSSQRTEGFHHDAASTASSAEGQGPSLPPESH